ncbi:hypothetical protein C0J52_03907 [Blattella germanica]|nr:hypothetical protein C0J52_03907 [Blattella germanica]PSN52073.1 hypothetical protein C0J52_03907 [Blattella germanica]PSN52074.1 hypothetical protein C0J52_03907 [Blattella germanica]
MKDDKASKKISKTVNHHNMDLSTIYVILIFTVKNLIAQTNLKSEFGELSQVDYNAALAAQVAKNRAAIAGTLAKQYGSRAVAEESIAEDLSRKSREKAYFASIYSKRAEKLEERIKQEEKVTREARKHVGLLTENAKHLKKQATDTDTKAKASEKLSADYRKKAEEIKKAAQEAEILAKEAVVEAKGLEELARNCDKFITDLMKNLDILNSHIRDLRKKGRNYMNKAQYKRAVAANQFEKTHILKKNAQEYERAASEAEAITKETLKASLGLHVLAEEEKSKIKVEEVKSRYDNYIAQIFQSQANDNKHFSDQQLKDSKFYGNRAKLAKARALVYQKTAQEAQMIASGAVEEQKNVGDGKSNDKLVVVTESAAKL